MRFLVPAAFVAMAWCRHLQWIAGIEELRTEHISHTAALRLQNFAIFSRFLQVFFTAVFGLE